VTRGDGTGIRKDLFGRLQAQLKRADIRYAMPRTSIAAGDERGGIATPKLYAQDAWGRSGHVAGFMAEKKGRKVVCRTRRSMLVGGGGVWGCQDSEISREKTKYMEGAYGNFKKKKECKEGRTPKVKEAETK